MKFVGPRSSACSASRRLVYELARLVTTYSSKKGGIEIFALHVCDDYGAIYHCLLQIMEDTMWSSSSPECGSAEDCYTDDAEIAKFPKPVGNKSKGSSCKGNCRYFRIVF